MKKYLLFDLDGTLTDPKNGITTCVQYALKSFGIEEPDLDKLEPFIGPPLKDSFMNFYGMDEEQAEKAVEKYRERFRDTGIFENKVYDGIPAMLRLLQSKGMHLAVASSKPTVFVERILEHFHLDKYFEVVVGSELDGSRVNKDEIVQEALNRLFHYKSIQREQVYMIGDRKFDVEGAKAHRIESVAVAYGYGSMEELKEAKADYIVRTVAELQKFLLRETVEEGEKTPEQKATPTQRIWMMAYPFLLFLIVRSAAVNILFILCSYLTGPIGDLFMIRDETGAFAGYTGNAATILSALSYAAAAFAIRKRANFYIEKTADEMKLSHLKKEPVSSFLMLGFATVGAVVGFNLLFTLTGFIDKSASYQAVAADQYAANLLVGLVCYGLVSPVAEELLFRGTLYNCLRRFSGVKMAIPVSALLFGIYHANTVQGIYGFLMGCLIAYGYEYFGNYKVPVVIHIVANVLAYCLSYTKLAVSGGINWGVCIVSLVVMAVCLVGLHRKKNIF